MGNQQEIISPYTQEIFEINDLNFPFENNYFIFLKNAFLYRMFVTSFLIPDAHIIYLVRLGFSALRENKNILFLTGHSELALRRIYFSYFKSKVPTFKKHFVVHGIEKMYFSQFTNLVDRLENIYTPFDLIIIDDNELIRSYDSYYTKKLLIDFGTNDDKYIYRTNKSPDFSSDLISESNKLISKLYDFALVNNKKIILASSTVFATGKTPVISNYAEHFFSASYLLRYGQSFYKPEFHDLDKNTILNSCYYDMMLHAIPGHHSGIMNPRGLIVSCSSNDIYKIK